MRDDPFLRSIQEVDSDKENQLPEDLLQEIDQAIGDSLTVETNAGSVHQEAITDQGDGLSTDPAIREMQETFLALVRNTLNPITRYMKAISLGESHRELLEISELIIMPLIPKVESVELKEHAEDLSFFRSLLLLALGEKDQAGTEAMREVVMEGFHQLSVRFGLSYRGYRLAVRNLVEFYRALRANDKVSEADVRRLFAIGIPSITWIRRTRVSELCSLSGIESDVMTQIRLLAYQYRYSRKMSSARLAQEDFQPLRSNQEDTSPNESVLSDDVTDASVEGPEEKVQIIRGEA